MSNRHYPEEFKFEAVGKVIGVACVLRKLPIGLAGFPQGQQSRQQHESTR
ncbi:MULTISPECIES: hypothetical protein [unclassified Pseudomonas]|nr:MULTISPECIES: hypothetical protein [unclassified Pseudomonas]QOF88422.1 hypothetical protein IG194_06165 [Pseudomonas sp. ADPe]